jgi:hypothetical protein
MGRTVLLVGECFVCHKQVEITVPIEGFNKWEKGALVQDAFPELPPEQREFLISNTCPVCFDNLFPPMEEEEAEEYEHPHDVPDPCEN